MKPLSHNTNQAGRALCLLLLFAGLFALCRLFPIVGDDWFREALGASLHSPAGLLKEVAARWATVNGRILGNVLSYSAGSRPLLRELMRALFTLALIALLSRLTGLTGWRGLLLCAMGALALPQAMFCQIYPWAAGFFNYVPPAAALLASLCLVRPALDGELLDEGPLRSAGLLLLGFCQQLFVENNTLYALCAALVLLVWYRLEQRLWSPGLLALLLGCALGAALLFASPSYRLIGGGEGAYQSGLGGGLAGLLSAALVNLPQVARWFLLSCPVLYSSFTALTLVLLARRRTRRPGDRVLGVLIGLGCLGLILGQLLSPGEVSVRRLVLAAAIAAGAVWWLAVTAALWLWLPGRVSRVLFLWLSAPVAAGPLLFVSPIGPRCLFLSYVLMLAAAGTVLHTLEPERRPAWLTGLVPAVGMAGLFCFSLSVFLPLHRLEAERTAALEEALASGAPSVVLPAYRHGGWLWDADSAAKMEQYYYRERPGDLAITFAPAGEEELS
ncbi:MAG: hypothetical protein HFF52_09770 [Lawsonibacter sp.]|nr:hypothetical protein [Lawsonibacter sp.]